MKLILILHNFLIFNSIKSEDLSYGKDTNSVDPPNPTDDSNKLDYGNQKDQNQINKEDKQEEERKSANKLDDQALEESLLSMFDNMK